MAKRLSRKKSKPFNPYQSPFKTQRGFEHAVNLEAGMGYKPQLSDLSNQGRQEDRAHTARAGEIESLYNSYGNELQQAYDRTTGALNNLVAQSQGASSADQAALRAALSAGQGQQDQLAQRVGAQPSGVPSNAGASATLLPAWGTAEANRTALGSNVAGLISDAAQRRTLPALGKIRSSEDESRRHFGVRSKLSDARSSILSQVPGLRLQARKSLLSDAREGQNVAFQQELAAKQFGLSEKQFGLDVRKQAHQESVDRTQLDQAQQQIDNAVAQGADGGTVDQMKAHADALKSGYDYADSLFKGRPEIDPTKKKGQRKRQSKLQKQWDASHNSGMTMPSDLWHALRTRFGLSDHDATVIVNSVQFPNFKAWAKRHRHGPTPDVQPNKGKKNPKPKNKLARG